MSESGDPYTPNGRADTEPTPEEISEAGVYLNAAENASQIRDAFTESGKAAVALITGPDGLTWLQAIAEKCGYFGQLHKPTEPGRFEEVVDLRPTQVLLSKQRLGARVERLRPNVDDVLTLIMKLIDQVPEYWAAFNTPGNEGLRDELAATIHQRLEEMSVPSSSFLQPQPSAAINEPARLPEQPPELSNKPDPSASSESLLVYVEKFEEKPEITALLDRLRQENKTSVAERVLIVIDYFKDFVRNLHWVDNQIDQLIASKGINRTAFTNGDDTGSSLLSYIIRYVESEVTTYGSPRCLMDNAEFIKARSSVALVQSRIKSKLEQRCQFRSMDLYPTGSIAAAGDDSRYELHIDNTSQRDQDSPTRNIIAVWKDGYMLNNAVLQKAQLYVD